MAPTAWVKSETDEEPTTAVLDHVAGAGAVAVPIGVLYRALPANGAHSIRTPENTMSIEKLTKLVPPPNNPIGTGTPAKWKEAEQRLGVALPEDYKAIVDRYGIGWFDNWVCIYSPFAESFNLFEQNDRTCSAMRESVENDPDSFPPYPLFPAKGGLLFIGQSDNSDALCYATEGSPKKWPIISMDNDYLREYHDRFEMGLADLLFEWLSGRQSGECLPGIGKRPPVFIAGKTPDYELMKKRDK